MSDQPVPMVGPVYGFRVWDVHKPLPESKWVDSDDDKPARLRSRGTTWTTPDQKAECRKGDDRLTAALMKSYGWQNHHYAGTDPAKGWGEPDHHKPAHDPDCWCGLYAHSTLARCLDRDERNFRLSWKVLGLVKATGRMFAADRGFRAERMEIDTLVCIHGGWRDRALEDLFRPHQPHVRAIADDLGVDVVCAKLTKKSLSAAFANREGVYLWRKEAPWTSAVTPEPTKSSTPMPQGPSQIVTSKGMRDLLLVAQYVQTPRQNGKASAIQQYRYGWDRSPTSDPIKPPSVSDIFGEGGGTA